MHEPAAPDLEVQVLRAAPQLPTRDVHATRAWYERHLGFTCAVLWQDRFLILERGDVRLHFYRDPDGDAEGDAEGADEGIHAGGSFYLYVDGDIDALAARMKADGADLHGPEDQPHGMREFEAHDPDGRHVVVGRELEGPA